MTRIEEIKARATAKCPECRGWGEVSYMGEMVRCGCNGKFEPKIDSADVRYLLSEVKRMREALEAAVDCGMVPKSSAAEGGALRHSRQLQVADQIRAALKGTQP